MAAAGAGSRAARGGPVLAAVWAVVSARTWLAVIHLLVGFFLGLVIFVVVLTGTVLGAALLVVALAGIPVLWAVLLLAGQFARAERARFALLLGERIPDPASYRPPAAGRWQRLRRYLAARTTWQHFGYALLRFPLSCVQFVLVLTVWPVALAMIATPGYYRRLPRGSMFLGGTAPPAAWEVAGLTAGGLILLLLAPQVIRGLAVTDVLVARVLLGPPKAQLQARIGELERSRAAVVDSAEAERRRIERDLHDGAQQRLVALAMDLGRARSQFDDDPDAARALRRSRPTRRPRRPWSSCAIWPAASIPRCSPTAAWMRRCPAWPALARSRSPSRSTCESGRQPDHRGDRLLRGGRGADQRRQARRTPPRPRSTVRPARRPPHVEISDDGVGGADPAAGSGLAGLADRVAGVDGTPRPHQPGRRPDRSSKAELPCGS